MRQTTTLITCCVAVIAMSPASGAADDADDMMTYDLSLQRPQTLDAKIAFFEHRLGLHPSSMVSHDMDDMFPSYSSLSHATAMPHGFVHLDFHGVHFYVAPLKRTSDRHSCLPSRRFDPFSDLSLDMDSLDAYRAFATKTD